MSFEAMTWAAKQTCGSSGAKFVLLMLADHANGHSGQCNPRIKRIAELCEMSESSVKNHIKTLESLGLVKIEERFIDGVQISNQYWLNFSETQEVKVAPEKEQPSAPDEPGLPNCPQDKIRALYAEILPELPQPRVWEGAPERELKQRWRWVMTAKKPNGERYAETPEKGLAFFERMFRYIRESDFLMGRSSRWSADLRWIVKAANFDKIISGNYENKAEPVQPARPGSYHDMLTNAAATMYRG